MSEPFLGELRLFPIGYVPKGWMACEGQTLSINQNQALYALLGPTYGGNGVTTFNLPDLRGRVPVHFTSQLSLGTAGGAASHTLTQAEMPAHSHSVLASTGQPDESLPEGNVWVTSPTNSYATAGTKVHMHPNSISTAGGSQAHNNMQPYIGLRFCIATTGIFPSRN